MDGEDEGGGDIPISVKFDPCQTPANILIIPMMPALLRTILF
jgi:hypothetical protein